MNPRPDPRARPDKAGTRVFVVPLILITGFAVYGQYGYGFDHYTRPGDPFFYKLAIALGAAIALESIANYVQWHAHRARLAGATAIASKHARSSYLIAFAVGGLNYAHFCDPGGVPTPAAVMFAAFSASSPWLWSLHTRRAEYEQLREGGLLDMGGARFRAERWKHFPRQTWGARRYSILHNITDPRAAWDAYQVDRRAEDWRREAAREVRRSEQHAAAGNNPLRALAVRIAGVVTPASGVSTGGVRPPAAGGAKPGAKPGATGGAAPVGPTGSIGVAPMPATGAAAASASLHAVQDAALQETATRWALAHDARREPIPGWRPIFRTFEAQGLSEHRAKKAAETARERAAGSTAVTVGGQAVTIRSAGAR